jgi:hypothetical protein
MTTFRRLRRVLLGSAVATLVMAGLASAAGALPTTSNFH